MNLPVFALKAYNGYLYAGGQFTTAGGVSTGPLARWDGTSWSVVPSPNPGTSNSLGGVAAISSTDAWAVGYWLTGPHMLISRTLIEHWDGRRWRIVPSPSVRASNGVLYDLLFAVVCWASFEYVVAE